MAITADDLAAIRRHIGKTTPPTDDDLSTEWDRLGTVEQVALSVLESRLADLLATPASLRVEGDYASDHSANIRALEKKIASLEALIPGGPGAVKVAHLTRAGRSR